MLLQGPDGKPLLLGPQRRLYSSSGGNAATSTQGSKSGSAVAVGMMAGLAGSAAKQLYSRFREPQKLAATPTWSAAVKAGTGRDEAVGATASQTSRSSGLSGARSGQLGSRTGSDIVGEQVSWNSTLD